MSHVEIDRQFRCTRRSIKLPPSIGQAPDVGSAVKALDRLAEAVTGDVEGTLLHLVGQFGRDPHGLVKSGM